jgi:hypothetical protein
VAIQRQNSHEFCYTRGNVVLGDKKRRAGPWDPALLGSLQQLIRA